MSENRQIVAGHLQEKKGKYYIVLNYKDSRNNRKFKWISTGLSVKGNKKKSGANAFRGKTSLRDSRRKGQTFGIIGRGII